MPIKFPCPHCKLPLRIDRKFAGRSGKCPSCAKKLMVPEIAIANPEINPVESERDAKNPRRATGSVESSLSAAVQQLNDSSKEGSRVSTPGVAAASNQQANGNIVLPSDQATLLSHESTAAGPAERESVPGRFFSPQSNSINIPRWIILTQGALLGTVALLFFLFGMMVGTLTSPGQPVAADSSMVELYGSVFATDEGQRSGDMSSVVIILPFDVAPETRPEPKLLRPKSYKALDNEAKSIIEEAGGKVVRANSEGNFSALLYANKKYQVLIISNSTTADSNSVITKQMRAELGSFFLPLEDLVQNQAFHWQECVLTNTRKQLDVVIFD